QQLGNLFVQAVALDIKVHEPGIFAMQIEDLDERRNAALIAEPAGLAKVQALQFFPCDLADVAITIEQSIEHVVVKHDEDAVFRAANLELVAVAAEQKSSAKCLESVFVRVLGRTPMADDVSVLEALGDALMSDFGLVCGFLGDGGSIGGAGNRGEGRGERDEEKREQCEAK